MNEKLYNLYLRLRWKYFRGKVEMKTFPLKDRILYLGTGTDFNRLTVAENERYNHNDVWFEGKQVELLHGDAFFRIFCDYDPRERKDWQGSKFVNWVAGKVETAPICNYGVWVITAKVPKGWPAIWLMREAHDNGSGLRVITPEVDIMEVIRGEFQHTIHYRTTPEKYATAGANNRINYDDESHEFAVDLRKDGYDFYIDGILTARFRGGGDSVSDSRCYLIINHAAPYGWDGKENLRPMYIKSIQVFKNEFTTKYADTEPWFK